MISALMLKCCLDVKMARTENTAALTFINQGSAFARYESFGLHIDTTSNACKTRCAQASSSLCCRKTIKFFFPESRLPKKRKRGE